MAFQSAPDCAEAVIQGLASAKQIANVLNFRKAGGYTLTDLQNLADGIDGVVGTDYLPLLSAGASYTQTLVRGLEFANDQEATQNAGAGVGTAGGTGLPANVSCCITLRSGFTGRSARGRFYAWPTGTTFTASPAAFTSGYTADLVAMLDGIKTAAAFDGWIMVALSRVTGGVVRPVAVPFDIATIEARNQLIDSMRSRLTSGH